MRIGVVSDTHGRMDTTRAAVESLQKECVDAVLHCGDIGSVEIPPLFSSWPTHFVFGNVDRDERELAESIAQAGLTSHGRFADLSFADRRIALLHGDDSRQFQQAFDSEAYDMICFGHTHVAELRQEGRVLLLNPGALHRARPHTIAVVELDGMRVRHIVV